MNPLSKVRNGWAEIEVEETRLLRQKTVAESVGEYLALRREFEPQLRETEGFFREERDEAMIQLQTRLAALHQHSQTKMEDLVYSLVTLQKKFEQAGLPSVVIGGLAVGVWGEPRLTRDVDIKVLAWRDERERVLAILHNYTPLNADPDSAFQRNGIAFFQDQSGVRIDVMLTDHSFDETVIGRAKTVELQPGLPVRVCSPEDLIIYKMVSVRTRDRSDVEGIIRRQGDRLDDLYVEKWLREFETSLNDSTLIAEYRRLRNRKVSD